MDEQTEAYLSDVNSHLESHECIDRALTTVESVNYHDPFPFLADGDYQFVVYTTVEQYGGRASAEARAFDVLELALASLTFRTSIIEVAASYAFPGARAVTFDAAVRIQE